MTSLLSDPWRLISCRRVRCAVVRYAGIALVGLFVGLTCGAAAQGQPDTLTQAKALYGSAAYDEALAVLDRIAAASPRDWSAVTEYRVFCLLALGRTAEARSAIGSILQDNPFYSPSEEDVSPRIVSVVRDARRELLPDIVRKLYGDAKGAFDRKDPSAAARFDVVLRLLDDPDAKDVTALSDMRTVASGFRDLSRAIAGTPTAPALAAGPGAPASSASSVSSAASATPATGSSRTTYSAIAPDAASTLPATSAAPTPAAGSAASTIAPAAVKAMYDVRDTDVVAPVTITQTTPPWNPNSIARRQTYTGVMSIVVDEMGNVVSATVVQASYPTYDEELLEASKNWKFKPATKDGVPVKYTKVLSFRLAPK